MNPLILNRDFQHPSDGWYQIEAKGDHPNRAAGVIQVIDDEAAQAIVNRFNADASAGTLRHGNEMLIDHEHFSEQPDQETRAYGWLQKLQNRADGIYGQIRWTTTGKPAVDGGDYRFFSTEYAPADLKFLNDGKPKRVRPLRLDGLTLTNMNNNRGQRPITNRDNTKCPDCGGELVKGDAGKMKCPDCKKDFADASASAGKTETNQKTKNRMSKVNTLLGLSADAEESSVIAEVQKLLNRGDVTAADLTTLRNRATALETQNKTLLEDQVSALMDAHGVKDEKIRNRLKPVVAACNSREERVAALVDFGFKQVEVKEVKGARVINRGNGDHQNIEADETDDQELAQKITNRANELKTAGRSFDSCWQQAKRELTSKK